MVLQQGQTRFICRVISVGHCVAGSQTQRFGTVADVNPITKIPLVNEICEDIRIRQPVPVLLNNIVQTQDSNTHATLTPSGESWPSRHVFGYCGIFSAHCGMFSFFESAMTPNFVAHGDGFTVETID